MCTPLASLHPHCGNFDSQKSCDMVAQSWMMCWFFTIAGTNKGIIAKGTNFASTRSIKYKECVVCSILCSMVKSNCTNITATLTYENVNSESNIEYKFTQYFRVRNSVITLHWSGWLNVKSQKGSSIIANSERKNKINIIHCTNNVTCFSIEFHFSLKISLLKS